MTDEHNEILQRSPRFLSRGRDPESFRAFHPFQESRRRVAELIGKSRDRSISREKQSEPYNCLQLTAKARAHPFLQAATHQAVRRLREAQILLQGLIDLNIALEYFTQKFRKLYALLFGFA